MDITELLQALSHANVSLQVNDKELTIKAPKGALTEPLRVALKQHKSQLIEYLAVDSTSDNELDAQANVLPTLIPDSDNRYEPFPLTDIQHAYWLGRSQPNIELGGVSTHLYCECLATELDVERLQAGFNQLIQRHDMLRAVVNDEGIQRVLPEVPSYIIKVLDLREVAPSHRSAQLLAIRNVMSHQVLPADCAPVLQVRVTIESDQLTRLHFSLDMMVLDALSMMLLFREWKQLYDQPETVLPPLAINYRDYVMAEKALQKTAHYEKAKEYWWDLIDDLPPAPQIPLAQSTTVGVAPVFSRRCHQQSADRWQQLQAQGNAIGLTSSGLVLAIFAEAVTLWSNSPHYSLNITLFNRQPLHPQVNAILGDFTSMLLLEVDHRPQGTSFRQRAIQLQQRFIQDLEHRAMGGLDVMREIRRRKGASMEATMPVVFTGALVYGSGGEDAGLLESFGPMDYAVSQTPQVCLDHQVMEMQGNLVCNWDCVDERFDQGTVDGLYQTFTELLERLVDEPECWDHQEVVRLPECQLEQRQITNETNLGESNPVASATLHGLFITNALKTPDAIAIVDSAGLDISYGRLLAISHQLAQPLIAQGLQPDQRVGIVMEKGWEQIAAALAVHIAGGAYLPISAHFPQQRQHLLLAEGGVQAIITQPHLLHTLAWPEGMSPRVVEYNTQLPYLTQAPKTIQQAHHLAYILFTSGSTGLPKAVMIEHGQAVNTIYHVSKVLGVTAQDRVLAVSAFNFDLSVYDIFGLLAVGGSIVIPQVKHATDPKHLHHLIEHYGVTLWNSAPALMGLLVDFVEHTGKPSVVESLRMVWMSGDRIPVALPDRIRHCFPMVKVVSLGGPTETSIWSVFYPVGEVDPTWSSIPYGKPLPNQQLYILNTHLQHCPVGVVGMIYVGGLGVGRGYLNNPEQTNKVFIQHEVTGERLYKSGDLGRYWPDGTIEILGRKDFQVKVRGYRIELEEIAAVLNRHPTIKQAVVTATEEESSERQLVAYIELQKDSVQEDDRQDLQDIQQSTQQEKFKGESKKQALLVSADIIASALLVAAPLAIGQLNALYRQALMRSLRLLGVSGSAQEKVDIEYLLAQEMPSHTRAWLLRGFDYLVTQGDAQFSDGSAANHIILTNDFPSDTLTELGAVLKVNLAESHAPIQLDWLMRNAEECVEILQEKLSLTDFYYLGDSQRSVEQLFLANSIGVLQQWLSASVLSTIENSPENDFTVFELGAGVGALTHYILPQLLPHSHSYVITEADEPSLEFLYDQFNDDSEQIGFGFFDIEHSLVSQGVEPLSADLIVAANRFYSVSNLTQALSHARELLKPNGYLAILEPMTASPAQDLHLGFKNKQRTLFSQTVWSEALAAAGFEQQQIVDVNDPYGYALLVAKVAAPATLDIQYIKHYLAEYLPDYMVPRHIVALEHLPLSTNGKVEIKALPKVDGHIQADAHDSVAPRNDVEVVLHSVWTSRVKSNSFGVQDGFFDLGGDSINAVQLVRDINQAMPSFHLEMYEFFAALTIEKLSDLYQQRTGVDNAAKQAVDIMAISEGDGVAHFFICPNNTEKHCYNRFATELTTPAYSLVCQDVEEWSVDVVQQLARDYVDMIRQRQPKGPYQLGGWSIGGLIAYECAVQLEAVGQEVDSLILFDTPSPVTYSSSSRADLATWFLSRYASQDTLKIVMELDCPENHYTEQDYFSDCIRIVNELETISINKDDLWPQYHQTLSLIDTVSHYPACMIAANITIFKPKGEIFSVFANHPDKENPDWGWSEFTTAQVNDCLVAGDHFDVINNAAITMQKKNASLKNIQPLTINH